MKKNKLNGFNHMDIFGTDGKSKIKKKSEKKKPPKLTLKRSLKVLRGMADYCDCRDYFMLILGLCCAFINGVVIPLTAIILGKVVNIILEIEFKMNRSINAVNKLLNDSTGLSEDISNYDPHKIVNTNGVNLSTVALFFLVIGIICLLSAFIEVYCWEVTCERVVAKLRKKFLSQVLRQDLEWFDKAETGDLSTRLTDDLERVRDGFGAKVALLIQVIAMIITGFIIALCIEWRFALVMSVVLPIMFCVALLASSVTAQTAIVEQLKYSEAGGIATEVLSGIRTVASFSGESDAKTRYDIALDEGRKLTLNKYYGLSISVAIKYAALLIMYALGLLYGAYLYSWGILDVGGMTAIFTCLIQASFTLAHCLPMLVDIGTALGAADSIIIVIQQTPKIDPYSDDGDKLNYISGEITFDNVQFAYPTRSEMLVLKGMTLKIPAGKIVALVGSSGAGKSTIVSLLLRFYNLNSGKILLDGIDIKQLNVKWLRKQVGIVSQEPVLFRVSIAENIRYGREDATMADIIQAAKLANAHNFITSLPQGYDTEVGDRGTQLSGGQKQRIAIARALVKDPKILLLDEATSALDSQSEAVVQEALDNAMQGRTTIIVAHRLSTVRNAHLICAMKDGVVEEVGNHEVLMEKRGLYYSLVQLQSRMDEAKEDMSQQEENDDALPIRRGSAISRCSSTTSVNSEDNVKQNKSSFTALFKVKGIPWPKSIMAFFLFLISGCAEPSLAYIYTQAIQEFLEVDITVFKSKMRVWIGSLGGIGLLLALFLLVAILMCATATERMIQLYRVKMFRNMLSQQVCWFDYEENAPNRVTNKLAREPPLVKGIMGVKFGMLVKCTVNIILAIIISYVCNWKLAFITLVTFIIIIYASWKSLKLQVRTFYKESNLVQAGFKLASECIQNIKTVQQIGLQDLLMNRYEIMVDEAIKSATKQALLYGTAYTLSSTLIVFLNAALCQFGSMLLAKNDIPPNNLLLLIFLASFTCPVIPVFSHFFNEFAKAMDPIKSLSALLSLKDNKFDTFSETGIKPELTGRIEFKNVKFTYPMRPEVPILKGLNLKIEPGQTVALVGPSGCGKSTTISLLERFYSPASGKVLVDGHSVKELHLGHLRNNIGLVTQEPTLFACSIRQNIAYGLLGKNPTETQIINAAKMANIHDFITTLPKGYDTEVGDKGSQMSGGQKQRIAIARALIRDPKILLLDEATSALDNESEKIVQKALNRAQLGRTCIVIAHRLSTIQNADNIVVISDGQIVEQGIHRELVKLKGLYYNMINSQHNLNNA